MTGRTTVIAAVALVILGGLYFFDTPSVNSLRMSTSESAPSEGVPGLEFKLSQISKNPPSLLVTLKNNNPSSPFTILKWGTPLDSAATNIGVFKLVNAETGEEVKQDGLMINRMMPPSQEDLVTVAPGTEEATEVVFDKPWMPKDPAKYKVVAAGEFKGVWDRDSAHVKASELEAYTDSPLSGRTFATEEVELQVE